MTTRIDIMDRIINLRALAESTSSQGEAMSAMNVAEKMMQAYRIEEAELALAEGLGQISVDIINETKFEIGLNVGRNRHKVQSCLWALELYCEVEIVLKSRFSGQGIHVIGDRPDVELFWYMLDLIRNSMDASYDAWKRGQQGIGRGAKASFQMSFAAAINSRLNTMRAERKAEREEALVEEAKLLNRPAEDVRMAVNNGDIKQLGSSSALVVLSAVETKHKAVQDAYREAYKNVKLGCASGFSYRSGNTAASAGRAAGNRASLGRGIGGANRAMLN